MISIKKISKYILGEPLFEEASFVLNRGDKIGLVGQNGCGKSTLLRIIAKRTDYDSGYLNIENERIGYLEQDPTFGKSETVESYLAATTNVIDAVLAEVGLKKIGSNSEIAILSGGQKTRLALAKILIQKPTALLLDEPTNHLDVNGLQWLEDFVADFKGSVLIVSHDRRFLDNTVSKIIEIDSINRLFSEYPGNYTDYTIEKDKRNDIQEDAYWRQQREKKRLEQWLVLKRQEAHLHADPAKGKKIRAMEKRLEREIYSQEIVRPKSAKLIHGIELDGENANAKLIARCTDISKKYDDRQLFRDINFEIRGKERVLLVGENGSGKTTLLKLIAGAIPSDTGIIKIGNNINVGYFAQEHEYLDRSKTVIEEFESTDRLKTDKFDSRAVLGAYMFSGQNIYKKVSDLSSGERVRLIFAKLTNQKNEFLVLDEPTNHLDISSREIIEKALQAYEGAVLCVSHDRYFIDKIGFEKSLEIRSGKSFRNIQ